MGILGNLLGGLVGNFMGGGMKGQIAQVLVNQVMNSEKGVGGILEQFNANGMGDIVSSWLGTGENKEISAGQVEQGLGIDFIKNIAAEAKTDEGSVSNELTSLLPGLIDKLSPTGDLPGNIDMGTVTSILGKLMK